MSWPLTQADLVTLCRIILQDTASDTNFSQQEYSTAEIGLQVERAARLVCSRLQVHSILSEAQIAVVDGQTVYELTSTAFSGAWDIDRIGYGPPSTTGMTGDRIDRALIRVSKDEAKDYMSGGSYAAATTQSEPRMWWMEPQGAWGTTLRSLQFGVWPAPETAGVLSTNVFWVRARVPMTAFATTLWVLSLPPPADEAIAELAASKMMAWRGDHADAQQAEMRYDKAMLTLQATYGANETQTPWRPVDVYENE